VNRVGTGILVSAVLALSAACGSSGPGTAAATPTPSPSSAISRTQLGQGVMPDSLHITTSTPSQLTVQQVTIAAGGVVPWHTHPGWEDTILTSGQLTLTIATDPGCMPRHLTPNTAFDVPAHTPHTARNQGSVPAVLVVTYMGVPPGATLATPVPKPAGCS
jgi:quercetin dioxygenase-like cupin family protein